MSKNYGMMIGCKDAIMWVKNLSGVNEMLRSRVVARMEYEFDKDVPVPMKYHKGLYGKRFDTYSCGNCGYGLGEAHWRYCPNCGFSIGKSEHDKKYRQEYEQITMFDFIPNTEG